MTSHPFMPDRPDFDPLTDTPSEALEEQPPKDTVNLILNNGKYRAVNKYGDLIGWPLKVNWKKGDEIYFAEEWGTFTKGVATVEITRSAFQKLALVDFYRSLPFDWQPPSNLTREREDRQ